MILKPNDIHRAECAMALKPQDTSEAEYHTGGYIFTISRRTYRFPIYHINRFTVLSHLSVSPFLALVSIFGPACFNIFTISPFLPILPF